MPTFQKPPTVNDDHRAQDIYRRAAEIIHQKGFEATSMGDIADSVDLTKGGLYYYIKGKRALLYAIMNFALDLLRDEVVTPALAERDPEARLASLVAGHTRLMIQEPSAMSILAQEEESLDEEHRAKIKARKRAFPEHLRDAVSDVLAAHEGAGAARIDPSIAAHSLLGMIQWVSRWYRRDGALGEEEIVAQLTDLALRGLVPETPVAMRL